MKHLIIKNLYSYKASNNKYCFWIVTTLDLPFSIMLISDQMEKKKKKNISALNLIHHTTHIYSSLHPVPLKSQLASFTHLHKSILLPGSHFSHIVVLTQTQPAGQSDTGSEWTHCNTPLEIWSRLNIILIVWNLISPSRCWLFLWVSGMCLHVAHVQVKQIHLGNNSKAELLSAKSSCWSQTNYDFSLNINKF